MSRGVNEVRLIGHLGNDLKVNPKRTAAMVSLGTNEEWKDKNNEKQQKTEWHNLQFYGPKAAIASDFLRKGSHVYVTGKLQTEKWQDNSGRDVYTTKIIVDTFIMLDKKQAA